MGGNKTARLKNQLHSQRKTSSPVPTWVVLRTKKRIRTNPQKRNWRRRKLRIA